MDVSLQRDSGVPLYMQVAEILKQRIFSGEYSPGSSLPGEAELSQEFGVARGTIRQTLSMLENEGLVRREQGRGTFVMWGERGSRANGLTSSQIGFVVPYVRDSFVSTILLGAERAASEQNLSVTFKHVHNDPARQDEVLAELVNQRLAGIILYPVDSVRLDFVGHLLKTGFPLVVVDRYLPGGCLDYVMSDHFGGALRATQHLIGLGHRRIGLISWRDPAISLEHRILGYRQALSEVGLEYSPDLVCEVEGYPTVEIGPLCEFLSAESGVTAVFAVNDQIALAVYKAARQLGRRIPDDLALVGFDNLDFTMHLDVPLTTVEQPAFEIGRQAVQTLVHRIENPDAEAQRIILPTRLIVRRSCGAGHEHPIPENLSPSR